MTKSPIFKIVLGGAVALVILGVLLALDLNNRGLAWQFFWSQTGEEEPLAQVRGIVEWAGNLIRPQPQPDPFIPTDYSGVNPYGVNTFLNQEVEGDKVEAQLKMISEAGFRWIRQEFPWQDIEVDGRGLFTDSRNDMDGDGQADTIDAWEKYDRIVNLAEKYGIQIQARLSAPPAWSRAEVDALGLGPPDDVQDFVNFAVAVAEHYRGRLRYFQIWNEPNIFPEWGTRPDEAHKPISPEGYTELLCRAYDALKQLDPEIVVISAAMAPTSALTDRDMNDFVFWERMYDAGAGECFDVLSMQGYGLNSGPTDRRMRPTNVTFARNLYIRELMVANGDGHKPIWISEAAWNYVPSREEAPNIAEPRDQYGQVTQQQAADYMVRGYQRAREEWPWIGVINYWYFTQPDDRNINKPIYYFRMVDTDYTPERGTFTPMPVYTALKTYITTQTPTLYQGVHQADAHWAITLAPDAEMVEVEGAQFDRAAQTSTVNFAFYGSLVSLRWRDAADGDTIRLTIDGESVPFEAETERGRWQNATIFSSTLPGTHTLNISSDVPFVLDSVMVADRTFENLYPVFAVGAGVMLSLGAALMLEWRGRRRRG